MLLYNLITLIVVNALVGVCRPALANTAGAETMKHINIKANFPGCGKSYVLQRVYAKDPFKRKYYITPQNKQCADVVDRLKSNNCINPNVQTYAHFVGNWQVIKVEDQTFYIMTDKPSKRAPTKKQIDLFIDEYSSLSKKQIDIIVSHFNVRNLITAGDANQFEPIPYHNTIYENGSKTKILAEYHDDGSLPDLPIDKQYVLTKTQRTFDSKLQKFIDDIKNAKDESIFYTIASHIWDENKRDDDLHIAYTNKLVDSVNNEYADKFDNKQYIVKNNDKQFGLLKGTLCNEAEHKTYVDLKRNVFQNSEDVTDADEALEDWENYMFGYSYAVTSHKLQGADVKDRNIVIHLSDIISFILAVDKDKTLSTIDKAKEKAKRIDIFHKFLYVAVSRASNMSQIHFAQDIDENSDKDVFPINFLASILTEMKPFADDNMYDAIYTTSDDFDYDELFDSLDNTDYCSYNEDIAKDAISMSYKEFSAKHQLSSGTYKRLRAKYNKNIDQSTPLEGSRNVAYKETLPDPFLAAKAAASNEMIANMHTLSYSSSCSELQANSSLFSPLNSWCVGD